MMGLHAFLVYCGIYALFIAVPGPGILAIIARSLASGFRSAIPAMFAVMLTHFMFILMVGYGLSYLASQIGALFLIVKLAGGAYLLYLGVRYWFAPVATELKFTPETPWQSFTSQFMVSITNPKVFAFFLALLPSVVNLKRLEMAGYLQLLAVCILIMPPIMLSYAAGADKLRSVLTNKKARKRLNRGAAIIMAGAGIGIAMS